MDNTTQLKTILKRVRFASLATVNEDGSPHNSPLVFLYDPNLEYIFWGSHPESLHSQNIVRTGQAFVAAFDSTQGSVGIYVKATDGKVVEGDELVTALKIHNHFRTAMGKDPIDSGYYSGTSPQKMWRAKVQQVWINAYERSSDGRLIRDYKIELKPEELKGLWDYQSNV